MTYQTSNPAAVIARATALDTGKAVDLIERKVREGLVVGDRAVDNRDMAVEYIGEGRCRVTVAGQVKHDGPVPASALDDLLARVAARRPSHSIG